MEVNGVVVDLLLDYFFEWINVCEFLIVIEEQVGREVCDQIEIVLDCDFNEMINVWKFLGDIQDEFGGFYFDLLFYDEDGDSGFISQDF